VRHSENGRRPTTCQPQESNKSKTGHARAKIADLFGGVGGFSLGAVRAGFEVAIAIDLDRHAIAGHKRNFPNTEHSRRNIASLTGDDLLYIAKLNGEKLVGIIGGPPCQGFSIIGHRRKNDSRNQLFYHFFRLVSEIKPLFFVAENVPGILNPKYEELRHDSLKLVSRSYTVVGPFTLCASDYGAATIRSRVFFVGVARRLKTTISARDFTNKKRSRGNSVRTAFSGLPKTIRSFWQTENCSWRRVEKPKSAYLATINRLCENSVGDLDAISRFREKQEVSGFLGTKHKASVRRRFSRVAPGSTEKTSKFPRLSWNGLCPTLRAGTDHRRGSYQAVRPIHPDENRVIAPREAARLQGFPDWFQFSPTKWHSFRQIGNSISPLVAEAVLDIIRCKLFSDRA